MRALGLPPPIFADGHAQGKGFFALLADVVIGRHGYPSLEASIQAKISN